MTIEPGQIITSQGNLAKQLHLGVQSIRTALDKLKSTGELTVNITNKYTLITITNWFEYQDTNSLTNNQLTGEQQASNRQLTTTKEVKNLRKKESIIRPDLVGEDVWEDFLALRKKKSAPVTKTVIDGITKEANKAGMSLNDALAECCVRGWQSFKADWNKKTEYNKPKSNPWAGVVS